MSIFELLNQINPQVFAKRKDEILKLIVANKNVIKTKSNDGLEDTPLHKAAAQKDVELVRLLCEHGAPLEAKNKAGKTPYQCALDANAGQAAELLAKNLDYSPLHIAAITNDVKLIRSLRQNGAQLEKLNSTGKTPFECALDANSTEVAKLLAKWGVDIERPKESCTLLHRAIYAKDYPRTAFLLSIGANCFAYYKKTDTNDFDGFRVNAIQLVAHLRLPEKWWRLLFQYGAGILCRISDISIDPDKLPLEKITADMFLFAFSFNFNDHYNLIKKTTVGCEQGFYSIAELKKSILEGKSHDLKSYIRTLKYINEAVPNAPTFMALLKGLQALRQELKGLIPEKKQPKSLIKLAMRYILLPPPLPANSQAQLIPPTTAQVQQPSIQTTAAGTVQDQQNTNERSISEQNVLDNPKLPQDFKDKLQDYSEKLKKKKA